MKTVLVLKKGPQNMSLNAFGGFGSNIAVSVSQPSTNTPKRNGVLKFRNWFGVCKSASVCVGSCMDSLLSLPKGTFSL